jgi:hypothetical protein
MNATKLLTACSVVLALMVVTPALAQEEELPTQGRGSGGQSD